MKRLVIAVVLASLLSVPTSAGAHIFWSSYDSGKSTVGRAALDGGGVNEALVTDIYYGAGVATDGDYVYWGESGSSPTLASIGRATVDGGEVDHSFQSAATYCGVFGLRATSTDLYWLKSTCSGASRAIDRAPKAGGGYSEPGAGSGICGFDVSGDYVYWSESHYIARAPNTVPPQPADHTWLDVGASYGPCAVAVNGAHVFWTNASPLNGDFRGTTIGRATIDGNPASVNNSFIPGVSLFPGGGSPNGLAVEGDFVYWLNQPSGANLYGSVGRANLDGTGVDYAFVPHIFNPYSLDVDSSGPAPAPPGTGRPQFAPPPVPRIVGVSSSHSSFAPGGGSTPVRLSAGLGRAAASKRVPRGTVFTYDLDGDAAVRIEVRRVKGGRLAKGKCRKPKRGNAKKRKCDLVAHAPLLRGGAAGRNRVPYTGRVKKKALRPGRYRAVFTASGPGGQSKSASVAFRIVKP